MQTKTLRGLAGAGVFGLLLAAGPAWAQAKMETPKYGGSLEVSTVYATLSALSFDSYDWPWKHNHDTGAVYEQLFATDLSKARSRGGLTTKIDALVVALSCGSISYRGSGTTAWVSPPF